MSYGKAVEEVWTWRDSLGKELEKVPESQRIDYINMKAHEGCRKLGINCRLVTKKKALTPNHIA